MTTRDLPLHPNLPRPRGAVSSLQKDEKKVSKKLFEEALRLFPGGVNSPVRAFRGVKGTPLFLESGRGARVWDADNQCYLDYCLSWGPLMLGHAHPAIVDRVKSVAEKGLTFGAPNLWEIKLGQTIQEAIPWMERMRFVSSGTEAVMSAVRVARAYTKRDLIVKFEGGYHGHADSFLVSAGSGLKTLGSPSSPGVTQGAAESTLVLKFNDLESFQKLMSERGSEIACVIIEPLPGNFGLIQLDPTFLKALREETSKSGTLLLFDEVISAFRVRYGAYADELGIEPDLITLGKVIGGGMPVGAYGGRRDIMELISPEGPVYQAGTLSGNPVAMAAGCETLKILKSLNPYSHLINQAKVLSGALKAALSKKGIPCEVTQVGSILWPFLGTENHLSEDLGPDSKPVRRFVELHSALLKEGIYIPPSAWEVWFLSIAHGNEEIQATVGSLERAVDKIDWSELRD